MIHPRYRVATALVLVSASLCLTAPAPAAISSPADTVFPTLGNAGYDVTAYDLDLVYHDDTRLIDATVRITARATDRLTAFGLDSVGAQVETVEVNGQPATATQREEKLTIAPATRIANGARFVTRVSYTADPRMDVPGSGWVYTDDGFAVGGQPDLAHSVFPCNDVPSDKARFVIHLDVPSRLTGVASGTLRTTSTAADRTRSTYVSEHPMATELLQIVVGEYTVVTRKGPHGEKLRDVVPTAKAAQLEPALALTPGQLAWVEKKLGPFPLETYGIVPINTDVPPNFDFTGLETQTLTLYRSTYLVQPEAKIASHMMHELVHSWFGNSVTPRTWSDLWINEGHADFYGLLYRYEKGWADSRGYTTMADRMRYTYAQGDLWRSTSGPVAVPTAATLWDNQRYTGGVLVLYALREKIGEEAFNRVERTFFAKYRDRSAGTEDYIRIASKVSGQDLTAFLRDWLYGTTTPAMPGHPDWTVTPVTPTPSASGAFSLFSAPPSLPHDAASATL
ncbi:MAG: M1 family metallopeptidase [Actinomycetales bacterium]|nr:M1 family metallopeptidase [Actinomycetales bacterium]